MTIDDRMLSRLMALAQDGDKLAYTALLESCQSWLRRYYARRIPPSALDDLVQETLISLHRKRASYDPSRPFLPWLAAIARFRWVDHLRKVYRSAETGLDDNAAASADTPEIESKISLDRLLEFLPQRQSDAIRLVKIDGLTIAEASIRCGQSEPLVKVNIHRGLKKLAALIEQE